MRKLAVIALTNTRIFLEATLFLTHRCFLTFSWIEPQMLPKCCLLHKVLPKHSVFCIFISMCISRSICFLFLWSVFPLSFSFLLQLPNLIETGKLAFFGHFYLKFSLSMLLSFFLIFGQFQPGVAYKSVAYEKKRLFNHLKYLFHFKTWVSIFLHGFILSSFKDRVSYCA